MQEIYDTYDNSYSILTPFAYCYLEELIRSTTSEYGRDLSEKYKKRRTGISLLNLAIEENKDDIDYIELLNEMKKYFKPSSSSDDGNNRNSVAHGYMHPRFWTQNSFENLVHDIARLSKYSKF